MMALNHGFSGYVCGRVAMPLLRRYCPLSERTLGWAFFLGAMMPDLDILAKLFGRSVYFSDGWYAHRHASHSILGTLMLAVLLSGLFQRLFLAGRTPQPWRGYLWLAAVFWCGGLIHILGDFFTPGWQMPIFWPGAGRYGALSHIGWFNPYLLWLFLATIAIAWGLGWLGLRHGASTHWLATHWTGAAVWALFALSAYRWVDFLVTSRYQSWGQWDSFQRTLLPEAMIVPLTDGVRVIWYWLTR